MRGRAWQITRAGLFLLFAVVLAALGPTDAALANQVSCPAISEHKPDTKEQQRDGEKLRERLPGLTTHRRTQLRHQHDRDCLRGEARWVAADFEVLVRSGYVPNVETDAGDARSRLRHSPAALQVMRH
ncbi:hypothetical protein [Saccharopolyspora dendranthemae]|uniref:Uncharacterized protein n=1 Tax=Saccharopolyspora dendranthemae TaxID=1181886 RepID=A0A561V9Y7_9PSEU|nr:hypothetical protein [Saccharopolyspora dendranthemae]TWG08422.1 hypothetical protein FHU35_111041 [Saccharopolyspora dendranthemae]